MLPLSRQLDKLPLRILKQDCQHALSRVSRYTRSQTKGELALRLSRALVRVCQGVRQKQAVEQGLAVLQLVKALTMEVHECNRIELFLIKIRTHLLAIRWTRLQSIPPPKMVSRAALLLDQIKATPFYDTIASDYYSHIERLYLQVIKEKVRAHSLAEAMRLMASCLQCLKAQIAVLGAMDEQDKKLEAILQSKQQLLQVLFRYEHSARTASSNTDSQAVTAQILPKYERIAQKAHSLQFPSELLLSECDELWMSTVPSLKQSRRTRSIAEQLSTEAPLGPSFPCKTQKHRESLQETAQYLDDFFRKRSNSAGQPVLDHSPIILPNTLLLPKPPQTAKTSYFRREKLQRLNENTCSEERSESVQSWQGKSKPKRKKQGKDLIQPKKFKLVLQMDRQARQKMVQFDPFASMKPEQLHMLAQKPAAQLMVC